MINISKETINNIIYFLICCVIVYGFLYICISLLQIVSIFLSSYSI